MRRVITLAVRCLAVASFLTGNLAFPRLVSAEVIEREKPRVESHNSDTPTVRALDATKVHDAGNVRVLVTNWGQVGSQPGAGRPWSDQPSAEWPAGSNTEYLWGAGLWIGAIKNLEPAVTTSLPQTEFRPGASELDRIYTASEGQAGGRRFPFPNPDDDSDGMIDEDWLDGRDNDNDGLIDEDFAAISDQMFFCEYRDTDPNIKLDFPEHEPLGIRVQQSTMSWGDRLLDDFIAFDLRLINESFEPLEEVYVGFFADCDIGRRGSDQVAEDDMAGFWEGIRVGKIGIRTKNVKLSIGYMFDEDTDEGESAGYIGLIFLGAQGPAARQQDDAYVSLTNFRYFAGAVPYESGGDPTNDEERYTVLAGTAPMSLPAPDPDTGLLRPGVTTANSNDYRMVVSVGPFSVLEAAETLSVQAALVLGQGFEGMISNAVQAQLTYDGIYLDRDEDPTTGVQGRETAVCPFEGNPCSAYPIAGTWPLGTCPTVEQVQWCDSHAECEMQPQSNTDCWVVLRDDCEYINADCKFEERTGYLTGVDGREHQVHWWSDILTPVVLSEFAGHADGKAIELVWRLSAEGESELVDVRVQRAPRAEGPYRDLVTLEPEQRMTYWDTDVKEGRSYWYRLFLRSMDGSATLSHPIEVSAIGTRWRTALDVPYDAAGGPIEIRYRVGTSGPVRLEIFDVAGRRVRTLLHETRIVGEYRQPWKRVDSRENRVARGIYIVRLSTDDTVLSKKIAIVR